MLAKAVARECGAHFIAAPMSAITSKWFGEAEKAVKALFSLAHKLVGAGGGEARGMVSLTRSNHVVTALNICGVVGQLLQNLSTRRCSGTDHIFVKTSLYGLLRKEVVEAWAQVSSLMAQPPPRCPPGGLSALFAPQSPQPLAPRRLA